MSTRIDINFKIVKQQMTLLTKEPLRQMDANYFYAVFDLCEAWSTVECIKASFARDDAGLYFVVDLVAGENGYLECQIPWEVLQKKGQFYVGVFGGNRILTNKVRVDVADSCYCDGEYPQAPTQDWFAKVEYQLEHITIDESQIETAVNDYLTEHPVTVTETDPTVPEWAKAATKPTYTADEVGAAPEVHSHDDLYYTKTQIDSAGYLTSIPAEYVTETELEAKGYITTIPSNYVTEESLSSKGFLTSVPAEYVTDTELNAKGYATTDDVATAVSDKVTMEDVHNATSGFVSQAYVDEKIAAIPEPDLSGYALKTEIPDVSGFITEIPAEYITESELNAKGYLTEHQSLVEYSTTTQVQNMIDAAIAGITDGEAVSY